MLRAYPKVQEYHPALTWMLYVVTHHPDGLPGVDTRQCAITQPVVPQVLPRTIPSPKRYYALKDVACRDGGYEDPSSHHPREVCSYAIPLAVVLLFHLAISSCHHLRTSPTLMLYAMGACYPTIQYPSFHPVIQDCRVLPTGHTGHLRHHDLMLSNHQQERE